MALTTEWPGGPGLPAGWAAFTPSGSSATVADGWLALTAPAATAFDTIFASGTNAGTNGAVCAYHAVPVHAGGAIDWAIQVSTDITDIKSLGIAILACDVDGEDNLGGAWSRWGYNKPNTNTEFANRFGATRAPGSPATGAGGTTRVNAATNAAPESLMSGEPAWIRFTFDGVSAWSYLYSMDGVTWYTDVSFTQAMTPTRLLIAMTSTAPNTGGTVLVAGSYDLLALGTTDLRPAPPARARTMVAEYEAGDVALPAGFFDDSAGGDSATVEAGGVRFITDATIPSSRARLGWSGARHDECGLLLRIQGGTFTGGSTFTTFGLLQDQGLTGGDPYVRLGGGYGVERGATIIRPIRVDNPAGSNVASVVGTTGLDEKRYGWLVSTAGQPTLNSAATDVWVRMERWLWGTGGLGRWRVRTWNEGDVEPSTWNVIDAQDDIERPTDLGPSLAVTHNNPAVAPTGGANILVPYIGYYSLAEPVSELALPPAARVGVAQELGAAWSGAVPPATRIGVAAALGAAHAGAVPVAARVAVPAALGMTSGRAVPAAARMAVAHALGGSWAGALPVAVRSAVPHALGMDDEPSEDVDMRICEAWPLPPTGCPLPTGSPAVTGMAVEAATDLLYELSGRQFGQCRVTFRPCRTGCAPSSSWWNGEPLVGSWASSRYAHPGASLWWGAACGSCGAGACGCNNAATLVLPELTQSITQVMIDGVALDPEAYNLFNGRLLVRTDGEQWPLCQDWTVPVSGVGAWSITAVVGLPVPMAARMALGQLAAEYATWCTTGQCRMPAYTTSKTRQGVAQTFPTAAELATLQLTGWPWVDAWLNALRVGRANQSPGIWNPDDARPSIRIPGGV